MATGIAAALLGAVLVLLLPNYYTSEVTILPVESKAPAGLGSLTAAAAAFGVAIPGAEGGDSNFLEIINSRSMREAILLKSYRFRIQAWRFGAWKEREQTLQGYLKAANIDKGVKLIPGVVKASKDAKSKLLSVEIETRSPELSQQVAHEITHNLERIVQEKGRTRGGYKASFAEARLKEARGELAEAEAGFRRFLEINRNYMQSADPTIRLTGLRLEGEYKLRQQLVTTLALNREQALMEEKNDIPILNILDPGNLPIEKSKPPRAMIVLIIFIVVTLGHAAWRNRGWIADRLLGPELPNEGKEHPEGVNP